MASLKIAFSEAAMRGVDLCKAGNWDEGLFCLTQASEGETGRSANLPGRVYSYLGYGIALRENRIKEGLDLCRHAVKVEFYEADNYLNLARTLMLQGNKRAVAKVLAKGLIIDPGHTGLLNFRKKFGIRRPAVLPFLDRSHSINVFLGKMRHRYFDKKPDPNKGGKPPERS